ncbi:hypothetical protein ES708_29581 [subsurface metagenome]
MLNTFINIKNKSFSITADINISKDATQGVILTQGGRFGGWSLYMKDGKPEFTYNFLGLERYVVKCSEKLPMGASIVKFEFDYDGGGRGKGGSGNLYVNGKSVGTARIEKTQPNVFSADETADVGLDNQTPVALGIGYGPAETKFNGKIDKVIVEIK